MSIKNSNDTIENRTRDLPACNAVPQPTAPSRVPSFELEAILMAPHFGVLPKYFASLKRGCW